nr:methyltransferase [Ardenticatena sp.]
MTIGRDLFWWSMLFHYAYLGVILWSVVFPTKRIWPPLQKWSWKYIVVWGLFLAAFGSDLFFVLGDESNMLPVGSERYALGLPLVLVGLLFLGWGAYTLGAARSLGRAGEFVMAGPYKLTRNPQYLGDILLFLGLMVIANSFRAFAGFALLILALLLMPLAEEPWLEEMYGDAYRAYRASTPRFF